jgi:hypothetical protein
MHSQIHIKNEVAYQLRSTLQCRAERRNLNNTEKQRKDSKKLHICEETRNQRSIPYRGKLLSLVYSVSGGRPSSYPLATKGLSPEVNKLGHEADNTA